MARRRSTAGRRAWLAGTTLATLALACGALFASSRVVSAGADDPRGLWAFHFEAEVGHTTETVLGTMHFEDGGSCKLVLRMNVGGLGPADKSSSACAWEWLETHPGIGRIRATLPGDEKAAFEFVIGANGRRMFVMLTAPPGFPSTGEAVRK